MATISELIIRLVADVGDFQEKMDSVAKRADQVGKKLTGTGKALTAGITLPLAGVGAAAIAAGTQLNAGMANVASLGVAAERVAELKTAVQELSVEVGKSTGDMTDGLYQVISAFGDTADTVQILEINAKAAAAGLATTTDAINLTSAVTKGYGDTSAEAVRHAADLAFQTVKLGQTTFPELAGAIGAVVPIAASLGVAQEELFGVMATGTGVTGTASEVATQLRGVLQSLMAPTGDMAALLEQMGYESGQAMLQQLGLQGTIEAVVQAAEASGTPLQKYISSIEGQTLALALAGPQADTFTQKLAAMRKVTGAADEAFRAQTEGINKTGFTMQQLAIRTQVLLEKLGDGLAPALAKVLDRAEPLIDALIRAADWFANADESTQTWIVSIGAAVAAIGPILVVLGTMASAISSVIGVITGAAGLVGALGSAGAAVAGLLAAMGPVGWVIGGVIAAVAGLALAWKNDFLGIRTTTQAVMDEIQQRWPGWISSLQSHWQNFSAWLGESSRSTWESVRSAFDGGGQALQWLVDGHMNAARWIFEQHLNVIRELFRLFGWENIGEEMMRGIVNGIQRGISWVVDAAREAARRAMEAAKSWLGIRSPSRVAALEIGLPLAQGVGVGFERGARDMVGHLSSGLSSLMSDLSMSRGQAATAGGVVVQIEQHFNGPADGATVRQAARDGVLAAMRASGMR